MKSKDWAIKIFVFQGTQCATSRNKSRQLPTDNNCVRFYCSFKSLNTGNIDHSTASKIQTFEISFWKKVCPLFCIIFMETVELPGNSSKTWQHRFWRQTGIPSLTPDCRDNVFRSSVRELCCTKEYIRMKVFSTYSFCGYVRWLTIYLVFYLTSHRYIYRISGYPFDIMDIYIFKG